MALSVVIGESAAVDILITLPAVLDVFDQPVLARCQLQEIRSVKDKLPQRLRSSRRLPDAPDLPRPLGVGRPIRAGAACR
jgi:hypothetical protein